MAEKPMPNVRLRSEREKRGWSRDYVAENIGSDLRSVGRWERGTTSPTPYYRQALCELFGMNRERKCELCAKWGAYYYVFALSRAWHNN